MSVLFKLTAGLPVGKSHFLEVSIRRLEFEEKDKWTFAPLFLLPGLSFTAPPLALTLVGQYIIKNIVIVSALFAIDHAPQKWATSNWLLIK